MLTPTSNEVAALRLAVKVALGCTWGSPEILHALASDSAVDPSVRWLVSVLRIWQTVARIPGGGHLLNHISRGPKRGRLAHAFCCFQKIGLGTQ